MTNLTFICLDSAAIVAAAGGGWSWDTLSVLLLSAQLFCFYTVIGVNVYNANCIFKREIKKQCTKRWCITIMSLIDFIE